MGEKYLSTGSFDLKEIYEESTAKTPLIFILSPSKFYGLVKNFLGGLSLLIHPVLHFFH